MENANLLAIFEQSASKGATPETPEQSTSSDTTSNTASQKPIGTSTAASKEILARLKSRNS